MTTFDYHDVRLRPLSAADLPMTLAWRNGERTRVWFKHSDILAMEAHQAWFDRYAARDDEFMYVIESRASGAPIGQVGLYALDTVKRECEGGRLMAAPSRVALGLMSQAVKAICDWGLRHLPIDRVYCEVFKDNVACLRAIRVAGFQRRSELADLIVLDLPSAIGIRADSSFAVSKAA